MQKNAGGMVVNRKGRKQRKQAMIISRSSFMYIAVFMMATLTITLFLTTTVESEPVKNSSPIVDHIEIEDNDPFSGLPPEEAEEDILLENFTPMSCVYRGKINFDTESKVNLQKYQRIIK